jgi:uncharacterized protein YkwD
VVDRGRAADPELAAGKWFTLAGRVAGDTFEVWANGRSIARGPVAVDSDRDNYWAENGISVGADVTADGPARLDIDHAAVWKLPPDSLPPPRDAYPGELLAYETFDDPKAAPPAVPDRPGRWAYLKDGRFVCEEPNAEPAQEAHVRFGPDAPAVQFAARVRATAQEWYVQFRGRAGGDRQTWLGLLVKPDGLWRLTRNRAVRAGNDWRTETVLLTEAPAPDPDLAAGRWVNLVVRSAGLETVVWANGRVLLTGREPEDVEPGLPPAYGAVAFNTRPGRAGPKPDAKFEIDYVAAWGPPRPDAPPAKDAYPGELLAYDTFDDPKAALPPGLDPAGRRTYLKDGLFVCEDPDAEVVGPAAVRFGPATPAVTVAARVRATAQGWSVTFRKRGGDRSTYLYFIIERDGSWRLDRGRDTLRKAPAADPQLAAGQWVNLVIRSAGVDTEVSANGRVLLTVREPEEVEPGLPPADRAVEFVTQPGYTSIRGAKFEIDYVAAWRPPGPPKLTAEEQSLLDRVNAERKSAGVPPVVPDAALMTAARRHADDMARWQKLTHVSEDKPLPERVKAAGYAAGPLAENVAHVGRVRQDPAGAVPLWLAAEAHKKNLLGKEYAAVGLGVTRDAKGETYVAAVFAAPAKK